MPYYADSDEGDVMGNYAAVLIGGAAFFAGSFFAAAQTPSPHPMSFFVTSESLPGGANFGSLANADKHCQDLAAAVGAGNRTWHAYLSVQERAGQPAIDARDRIGTGPWYNAKGTLIAADVAALHAMKNFPAHAALNEKGVENPGRGTPEDPADKTWPYMQAHPGSIRHEILTGSTPEGRAFTDGRDHTCNNWTSEEDGNSPARARFNTGHGAEIGKSDDSGPWNSQGISGGCNHVALARSHGAGLFYCFAAD
jgi:hypothetical protein